jgi:hypothetical protein
MPILYEKDVNEKTAIPLLTVSDSIEYSMEVSTFALEGREAITDYAMEKPVVYSGTFEIAAWVFDQTASWKGAEKEIVFSKANAAKNWGFWIPPYSSGSLADLAGAAGAAALNALAGAFGAAPLFPQYPPNTLTGRELKKGREKQFLLKSQTKLVELFIKKTPVKIAQVGSAHTLLEDMLMTSLVFSRSSAEEHLTFTASFQRIYTASIEKSDLADFAAIVKQKLTELNNVQPPKVNNTAPAPKKAPDVSTFKELTG